MIKKNKNFDLDAHEKEIVAEFEKGNFISVSDADEQMQIAKQAATTKISAAIPTNRLNKYEPDTRPKKSCGVD